MKIRNILGTDYTLTDSSVKCFTDQYWKYSLSIMLPIISVFGLLIPLFLFFKIRQQYQKNNK